MLTERKHIIGWYHRSHELLTHRQRSPPSMSSPRFTQAKAASATHRAAGAVWSCGKRGTMCVRSLRSTSDRVNAHPGPGHPDR